MSNASAPSALCSQPDNCPAAAASWVARKRSRISSSNAVSFLNQRSGPAFCQNATTSAAVATIAPRINWLPVARAHRAGRVGGSCRRLFSAIRPGIRSASALYSWQGVQVVCGDIGFFPDRIQLADLAGVFVRHADDGAFEQAAVAHGYFLDLVR